MREAIFHALFRSDFPLGDTCLSATCGPRPRPSASPRAGARFFLNACRTTLHDPSRDPATRLPCRAPRCPFP